MINIFDCFSQLLFFLLSFCFVLFFISNLSLLVEKSYDNK